MNDVPLSIRAAMALSEGQTLKAHLCTAEPKNKRALLAVAIGNGHLSAQGGTFRTYKAGYVRVIATEFDGELVISKPSKPAYAARGLKLEIGPTILATREGSPN